MVLIVLWKIVFPQEGLALKVFKEDFFNSFFTRYLFLIKYIFFTQCVLERFFV